MSNKTFYRISLEECKKLEEEERASWALEARKSASNQRRFDTLTPLIEKYYSNKMATERESRATVTPDEWAQYQETKCLPKPPKMPPFMREQFTKYNALLRSADRRVNRAENSTAARESARISRSHLPNYKSPYRLAEQDYDHALIILEELLRCEPNARQFLDRPVYFEYDHPDTANPDQDSVPRLLNCSSPYRRREGEHYPSNSELRLSTLLASRNKLIDVA